jgi:acyl phosphate:glycerol-3-phosphate acyltransferase
MNVIPILARLIGNFAIGSIPFAVICMAGTGIDIRKVGSGNPGFNNVLRVSKPRAILTLVGDMGKGALAVWLALHLFPIDNATLSSVSLGWIYGFGAILGHCFSPFLKFNGGKGIATSGGVMLILYPAWAALALAFFAVTRMTGSKLKWREAGMTASMGTWVLFTVLMWIFQGATGGAFATVMTLFLAWRHKKNFQSLFSTRAPANAG